MASTTPARRRRRLPDHDHLENTGALVSDRQAGVIGRTPEVKRIMVVDGHSRIRALLVELLASEPGLEVVATAATGGDAVELANCIGPDTIVIDPELAGIDGADATRQILTRHPRTHVLVLTAAPHGTLTAQTLAAGARTCLPKSAAYTAIVNAIRAQ